jgi:hypothetical protein
LESKVEHAYLKGFARELRRKDKIGGPVLPITPYEALSRKYWEPRLFEFLFDFAVKHFGQTMKVNDVAVKSGKETCVSTWSVISSTVQEKSRTK